MRRRHTSALVAGALASMPAAAAAQATSLHGTGDFNVAVDTNVGSSGGQATDVAFTVSPGLLLLHRWRRGGLAASWTRSFVFFVRASGSSASTDEGSLDFNYRLSELDTLGMSVGLSRASTNFISLASPTDTSASAQPTDPIQLLTPSLAQRYDHTFSRRWSLTQTSNASVTRPLGAPDTASTLVTAGASLGPDVQVAERHALGFAGIFRYYYLNRLQPTQAQVAAGLDADELARLDEPVHQLVPGGEATWRWQLADLWSTEATGGVLVPITLDGERDLFPTARLAGLYQDRTFGASLVLRRSMSPSFQTRQIFLTHSATFSASLPIVSEERIYGQGAAAVAHNQVYATDDLLDDARAVSVTFDIGASWTPESSPVTLLARYQHARQLASNDPLVLQEFARHVVSLGASMILPEPDAMVAGRTIFEPVDARTPGGRPLGTEQGPAPGQ